MSVPLQSQVVIHFNHTMAKFNLLSIKATRYYDWSPLLHGYMKVQTATCKDNNNSKSRAAKLDSLRVQPSLGIFKL